MADEPDPASGGPVDEFGDPRLADEGPVDEFMAYISPGQEGEAPREEFDLARAAFMLARATDYPDLDVEAYLGRLDRMAAELGPRIGREAAPTRAVTAFGEYFFGELGFRGNERDYYDPRNSFLNEVLDRRLGIPITLSAVYLEVARRIGFRLEGVGMPGHFLVRHPDSARPLLIDPFNRGVVVTEEQCRARLRAIYGPRGRLTPEMLAPIDNRAILVRMLRNLKGIYAQRRNVPRVYVMMEYIQTITGPVVEEDRDFGLVCYEAGELKLARQHLEDYLRERPDAPDAPMIRDRLAWIDRLELMRN